MIEICAIVRDENEYLKEWIIHHLSLGFDQITLYDNKSQVSPNEVIKELPLSMAIRVTVYPWDQDFAQIQCYTQHAKTSDERWCLFIDIDEFLILKKHKNIQEYVDSLPPHTDAMQIHWVCYSANGHWKKPPGGVVESYTKPCVRPVSDHFKTLVRPNKVWQFEDPHQCKLLVGRPPDESLDVAQINHYFTKSYEEWERKVARGRADTTQKRTLDEFYWYNDEMRS